MCISLTPKALNDLQIQKIALYAILTFLQVWRMCQDLNFYEQSQNLFFPLHHFFTFCVYGGRSDLDYVVKQIMMSGMYHTKVIGSGSCPTISIAYVTLCLDPLRICIHGYTCMFRILVGRNKEESQSTQCMKSALLFQR